MNRKRFLPVLTVFCLLAALFSTPALAAGSVADAVEQTWGDASEQIRAVVDSVVFPASTCARIPTVTFFVPNFRFLSVRFCDALISPLLKKAPHMRGSFSHPYAM